MAADLYGTFTGKVKYDLMTAAMIRLGKKTYWKKLLSVEEGTAKAGLEVEEFESLLEEE